MKETLVLIDMQEDFDAALRYHVIASCKREIRHAIKNRSPIIIVKYKGCGPLVSDLEELVYSYKNVWYLHKAKDDGSKGIICLLKGLGLANRRLRICGVNTDACVKETVEGLLRRKENIRVNLIASGCASARFFRSSRAEVNKEFDWVDSWPAQQLQSSFRKLRLFGSSKQQRLVA